MPLCQLPQFSLLGATQPCSGRPQIGRGEGGPTLAVWPKVALAALGCVDDHGAVPTAAIPPQPIGPVRAPVDPFLGVACAGVEEGKNTGR